MLEVILPKYWDFFNEDLFKRYLKAKLIREQSLFKKIRKEWGQNIFGQTIKHGDKLMHKDGDNGFQFLTARYYGDKGIWHHENMYNNCRVIV